MNVTTLTQCATLVKCGAMTRVMKVGYTIYACGANSFLIIVMMHSIYSMDTTTKTLTRVKCDGITWEKVPCKNNAVEGKTHCRFHGPSDKVIVVEGGHPQCKAMTATSGHTKQCRRLAISTYPVCQKHGAGSPFKGRPGGRPPSIYRGSKKLPRDLDVRLRAALDDDDLLNLSRGVAVAQARIAMLLEKLPEEDEISLHMDNMLKGAKLLKRYETSQDADDLAKGLLLVTEASNPITAERKQWQEIMVMLQSHSRLVAKEMDRRKAIGAFLRAEEAFAMVKVMVDIVNDKVEDRPTRLAIGAEFAKYFTSGK